MATQLLLIEDVEDLGLKGELVSVKPGYARNFLVPNKVAVIADKNTMRSQERLKKERQQRALDDRKDSEALAAKLEGVTLEKQVKVDHEGRMYGSVSVADIIQLIEQKTQLQIEKKSILLKHAIKELGTHSIELKLKEGVSASINLEIISE